MKATVTSKGQVTIPHVIREQAHIFTGSLLDFQYTKEGFLIVRTMNKEITKLKGIVKSKRRTPVSLREMKKAIRSGAEESMQ